MTRPWSQSFYPLRSEVSSCWMWHLSPEPATDVAVLCHWAQQVPKPKVTQPEAADRPVNTGVQSPEKKNPDRAWARLVLSAETSAGLL